MSASLVGSEMCIRDRLGRLDRHDRRHFGQLGRLERLERLERHERHVHGPVSYTHLTLPTICSV
eukprot:10817574-Alexandrium_andersonii.AAC.1